MSFRFIGAITTIVFVKAAEQVFTQDSDYFTADDFSIDTQYRHDDWDYDRDIKTKMHESTQGHHLPLALISILRIIVSLPLSRKMYVDVLSSDMHFLPLSSSV